MRANLKMLIASTADVMCIVVSILVPVLCIIAAQL